MSFNFFYPYLLVKYSKRQTIEAQNYKLFFYIYSGKNLHDHSGILHDPAAGSKLLDGTGCVEGSRPPIVNNKTKKMLIKVRSVTTLFSFSSFVLA